MFSPVPDLHCFTEPFASDVVKILSQRLEKTDVRKDPGHPEEVHVVVIDYHGDGGGHPYDDHQEPDQGGQGCLLVGKQSLSLCQ